MTESSFQQDQEKFIAEIQRQLAAGEYVDFIALIDQFPECAERLRELMLAHRGETDTRGLDESVVISSAPQATGMKTTVYNPGETTNGVDDPIPVGTFGDYELIEQVATGGMGVVFRAHHFKLDRVVALKAIRNGRFTSPELIARFLQEARAAGILTHRNIVPVYDYGEVEGYHYFTMEFVEGTSLDELIREHPLPAVAAAEYLQTVAEAVHYAHGMGIIHRDIKPSNVLITANREARVTDFGVAEPLNAGGSLMKHGQIVGTPNYMSPEQACGDAEAASPATDIYSMGALLYTLLTSRPPFHAETVADTLNQVRTLEPVSPRLLNDKVPRDLETICLKCLKKDPHRRYSTAQELADDLGRFIDGKPILARPVGRIGHVVKACRRNPLVTLLTASAILLAIALIAVQALANSHLNRLNAEILDANRELEESRYQLRTALDESRSSQEALQELLYVADMKDAGKAWANQDMRLLVSLLERQRPRPGERDLRGGEWEFLWNHARIPSQLVAQIRQPLYYVCFSPDGSTVATSGRDAVIRLYDAETFFLQLEIETGQIEVNGLAFTSKGDVLASAGDDGTVCLWQLDLDGGRATKKLQIAAHEEQVFNVALTPDSKTIVSAGNDPVIRIWDAETGESVGVLEGHQRTTGAIALTSDGRHLVSGSNDGQVAVWDMKSRKPIKMLDPNIGRLTHIDVSPDGRQVVIGSADRRVEVRKIPTLERTHQFEHLNAVQSVRFAPDGGSVIASDRGGMIRYWPLTSDGHELEQRVGIPKMHAWKAHRDRVYAMAISPQGDRVLSVGTDGKLLAWQVAREPAVWGLENEGRAFESMQFAGLSGLLATVDQRRVELWNPENGRLARKLWESASIIKTIDTCQGGRTVAVGGEAGLISVWDLERGDQPVRTMDLGDDFNVDHVCVSSDGTYLAAVERFETSEGDVLRVFNLKTGERIASIESDHCDTAAFSPDERWLFSGAPFNNVQVWRLPEGELVFEDHGHVNSINEIKFSQNGRWAATASDDRLVKLWNVNDWSVVHTLDGHLDNVESVTFSPDSQTLASAADDGQIKFWNVSSGQMLFELSVTPEQVSQIAFSPDGRFLACRIHDPTHSDREYRIDLLDWQRHGRSLAETPRARR
ncbi:MAG: serine/threonine protein kinase [Planctomycetaceae bacterium]|nr:serine/threonine protein kinase [Planctomycetaceae bacterium]